MNTDDVIGKAIAVDNEIGGTELAQMPEMAAKAIVELKRSIQYYRANLELVGRVNQNKEFHREAAEELSTLPPDMRRQLLKSQSAVKAPFRINNHSDDCGCEQCEF